MICEFYLTFKKSYKQKYKIPVLKQLLFANWPAMLSSEHLLALLGVLLRCGGRHRITSSSCSDANTSQSRGCRWSTALCLYFGVCGNTLLPNFVVNCCSGGFGFAT